MDWRSYEKVRMQRYSEMSVYNSTRRVSLGDRLSLIFENRRTVLHQIQEMVYLDKLEKPESISHEIEVYSTMIPCNGHVKATLFINAFSEDDLRRVFDDLSGIYDCIYLVLDHSRIHGEPEAGRTQGKEFSTVQFLTFNLGGEKSENLAVEVDHRNYKFSAKLSGDLPRQVISEAYQPC